MKPQAQVQKMREVANLRDNVLEAVIRGHPSDVAFNALAGLLMKVALHMAGNDLDKTSAMLQANHEMMLAGLGHSKKRGSHDS